MTALELWVARLLGAAVVLALAVGGGFWWGHATSAHSCEARAGRANANAEAAEDRRDANIDAIGAATGAAVAQALAQNRSDTDESTDRIRTIVVPGACRDVDPGILRELDAARAAANAALGIGVRPGAAGPGAADPAPAPGP